MKKLLQFITFAALTATPVAVAQNLSVDGVEGSFNTFQEAFNAIENEGTIIVLQDFTAIPAKNADNKNENAAMLVGSKKITVKGENHNIDFATFYLFNLQNVEGSLNVENLTMTYTGENASNRGVINVARGSINLSNITIKNANVASTTGIIGLNNGNSNIPSAVLNGVKLEKCTTTAAAEVLLANNNLTISGDCSFSLYVNNVNSAFTPSTGENLAGSINLTFAKTEVGATAVRNCTDANVFTLINDEKLVLESDGTNLVIAEKKAEQTYPVYIGEQGYETLNAAITAVEDGGEATIELKEDITLSINLSRTAGKTITVNGNGFTITRGDIGDRFIGVTNNEATSLTFSNVTIDGNNTELKVAAFQASNSAKLYLNDVTFANFNTTNARGILDAANGGSWHLNNVKFENCAVANQQVTTNASDGCSITGDNFLTMRINGQTTTVNAEGINNATPVAVTLGDTTPGRIIFTGCSDTRQFECANSQLTFKAIDGNIVLAKMISTGIDSIEADNTTPVRYFNLQGIEVSAGTLSPGTYIAVKGNKTMKIMIR